MGSGKLRSALVIGGQGIRARKLRTFLSMTSLFLGVLAVLTVQAGAEIAERAMLSGVELTRGKDGTLQMFVPQEEPALGVVERTLAGRSDGVAVVGMNAIIGEPGVRPINDGAVPFDHPRVGGPEGGSGKPDGQAIEVQLEALTGDVRGFRPFRQVSGQWLDFASAPALAPRIVVNEEAAIGLRRHRVPGEMALPGAAVHVTPQVVGVVEDGSPRPSVYVRMDELRTWPPGSSNADTSRGGSRVQVMLSPSATDLVQTLRSRLIGVGVPADELDAHPIDSREELEGQLSLVRLIFLGMAALVLLIGVAGILNVGLATVGERVEELALRRAVGTSRLLLAGIVLAETLLTGLLTAVAAIGTGAAGVKVGSALLGPSYPALQGISFPWQAGVAGVVAGVAAGVLGGLVPAIRAARIPIAAVMRA
ncbi:ABC transporter permease [Umezawaea endophytica]|uniref:ABC transporter permease n=1 Tax=Umezawaea endophytica TaxID=1654476 RepID=A0A9X2VJX6_9PSEU|nr:ABC transporter permease [Umezawaea endophytica]MCS7477754.1 ABC transporter permease [Umezawaea endophytica]